MNWFIVFFSLINISVCIYEDQIGKFDWRQSYVGRIKFAQFDTVSTAKKIIVATEENVLAALNLKTGQLVWRHVFESTSSGNIQLLHVGEKVVTVTGSNPYLIRGWDTTSGVLLWEWSLYLQNEEQAEFSEWWVKDHNLVHVMPVFGSHLEVTLYNLMSGENKGATSKMPAVWSNEGCAFSAPYYTCISGPKGSQLLTALHVTSQAAQLISRPLSKFVDSVTDDVVETLDGTTPEPAFLIDGRLVVVVRDGDLDVVKVPLVDQASLTIIDTPYSRLLLQIWTDENKVTTLTAHQLTDGSEVPEMQWKWPDSPAAGPELAAAWCTRNTRDAVACRLLLSGADHAVYLMHQSGRVLWSREEALANVVTAEFVDLPVSALDAAIESEFDQKEGSIWAAFSRRLQTQLQQLRTLAATHGLQSEAAEDAPAPLVRDYFNLHKIIVLVTEVGKIFGIDNLSGEVLWQWFGPQLDAEGAQVFTRRSARHPPLDAYVTIVGKHAETGNGLIISMNPIRGTLVGEGVLHLDAPVLQCTALHTADNDKLHALILLDKDENVQVLPISAARLVENMFMYVADKETAKVWGYALKYDGQHVIAEKTWSVDLGGQSPARIVAVAGKPRAARVHSPGLVLGDRSVLYKYTNPNLVLFVTQGPDPTHKDVVTATCVDAVSGAVVCAQTHRRARALPLAVHADHFMAYLYYSDKHRRTEIASVELFEGSVRWSDAGLAFSSLSSWRAAIVERAAYILPAAPRAAAYTRTERSLTDTHLLLALSTGAIVEIPCAYLDARRPLTPTPEQREEGLVPYAPELPLAPDAVLNYNRTLPRLHRIYTAPAGIESTSLVLATGLDLFYTRVSPSKTFDLLKDDFDYYLITIVLAALVIATYSTKYFASRKMLRNAWK